MKKIPLTKGYFSIVDEEDYYIIIKHKWCVGLFGVDTKCIYALRRGRKGESKTVYMHRQIMNASKDCEIDHINGNGLDNRKCNLRVVSHSQNMYNKRKKMNTSSKFKGVSFDKKSRMWDCRIHENGKQIFLGRFKFEKDAAIIYNQAAKLIAGEYCNSNKGV